MHVHVYIVVDSGKCVSGKGWSILSASWRLITIDL